MLVKGQSEFSYRPAAQFNILAVAPEDAPFLLKIQELKQDHQNYEIIAVSKIEDALKLLRRGTIAAVLADGNPRTHGLAELLVEGLSKDRAPRFVVFFKDAPGGLTAEQSWVRIVRSGIDGSQLGRLLEQCCQEFDRMPSKNTLTPLELLEALAYSPDEAWIRVTHESGESGDLCIRDGKAVYCEVGRMSGATAAARLLAWTPCRFEYRDFPSFLMPNLDRSLSDLRSLRLQNAAQPQGVNRISSSGIPGAPPAPSAPPAATEPAVEEPTEFPVLENLAWAVTEKPASWQPVRMQLATDSPDSMPDEPEEFPAFRFDGDGDFRVEEPSDMAALHELTSLGTPVAAGSTAAAEGSPDLRFAVSAEGDEAVTEEPLSFPDFDMAPAANTAAAAAEGPADSRTESSFFAAVAVVSFEHLLSCQPADEATFFEARTLHDLFGHATRYSRMQGLGDQDFVVIGGKKATIALAPIHGSESLLAVRLKGQNLGDPERYELHRLQEAMQLTYAAVSV